MKCISLWQPWASLIALGHKRIETRSWAPFHRGPLVIHAAKYGDAATRRFELELREEGLLDGGPLPLGAAICIVELLEVQRTEQIVCSETERRFGDYRPGRWGWMLQLVRRFDTPLPIRGRQQLFDVAI